MSKFMKAFKRGEKGFTLIELLIVIAILGILAAVAIPALTNFIGEGKVSAANGELGMINVSMAAAMTDAQVGSLPGPALPAPAGDQLTTTLSKANDFIVSGNITVGKYIQGGYPAVIGVYTFDSSGKVVAATYNGLTAVGPPSNPLKY